MTKAGMIPLSDIAWIRIHFNAKRRKCTKAGLKLLLQDSGGDLIFTGPIFLRNEKPCTHLKTNGTVKWTTKEHNAWAISWNEAEDFGVEVAPNGKANYMACVKCIIDGKKVVMDYQPDMKYPCNRVAVGVKDGMFAYYATEDNLEPEDLQERLFQERWEDAIMNDGGGSACIMDKHGDGFAGDGRYIPYYIAVKLKEKDIELKGEKPMDFEIKAYSLKKEGEKYLAKNFQVKEFACKDGSDTVFIAEKLPMVCQYIRVREGKSITPSNGYRTPGHNASVGGEEFSMHLYGAAVDLLTPKGSTPQKMAGYAREIMPDWGGVGIYEWGIHVDVSPIKRDWNG